MGLDVVRTLYNVKKKKKKQLPAPAKGPWVSSLSETYTATAVSQRDRSKAYKASQRHAMCGMATTRQAGNTTESCKATQAGICLI